MKWRGGHQRRAGFFVVLCILAIWVLAGCAPGQAVLASRTATITPTTQPAIAAATVVIPAPRPTIPVITSVEADSTPSPIPPGAQPTLPPGDDPAYYYGGLRITLDNVGEDVHLRRREWFLLALGDDFDWEVTAEPATVLSISTRYRPAAGEQGIYVARGSGTAELIATGNPKCLKSEPPCARPSVLFKIKVVVE